MSVSSAAAEPTACKTEEAHEIVRGRVWWAVGAGAIPVPGLDLVSIIGVNLKLLSELAHHYDTPFKEDVGKSAITALFTGLGARHIGMGAVGSLLKAIPVAGSILGLVAVPITAGALTYATGKVFIKHFESGGTLLDFSPSRWKRRFKDEFHKGKDVAAHAADKQEEAPAAKSQTKAKGKA